MIRIYLRTLRWIQRHEAESSPGWLTEYCILENTKFILNALRINPISEIALPLADLRSAYNGRYRLGAPPDLRTLAIQCCELSVGLQEAEIPWEVEVILRYATRLAWGSVEFRTSEFIV